MPLRHIELMHEKLSAILVSAKKDVLKFDRGNNTAGIRIRAVMQDVRNGAKDIRDEIQRIKRIRKQIKKDAKNNKS